VGYKIIIHHLAGEDILEIARWYDVQLPGLGNRFENDLEFTVEKLLLHPHNYSALFGKIRKIVLQKFPYLVFFEILEDEIHVYGVIHTKRKPVAMKKRFRKIKFNR
jgi:toxin ParE1/3/4